VTSAPATSAAATAQLFGVRPAMANEGLGVRAWFIDSLATVVTQVTARAMTAPVAEYLRDEVYPEAVTRYVRQGKKPRFVHDWRALESYEAGARDILVQWGHTSLGDTREVLVGLGTGAPSLVRFTASTGIALLRVMGNEIRLVDDVGAELAALAPHVR
jgi:hypothetical protein